MSYRNPSLWGRNYYTQPEFFFPWPENFFLILFDVVQMTLISGFVQIINDKELF